MWKFYMLEFFIVLLISIVWATLITTMKEKHPDYKGEDFLNEENEENEKE